MIKSKRIPKKIHYCWFGKNPLPDNVKKCIESWKKYCPDYEIIQWNESNFDLDCCGYVKEAYNAKKWAFVTDYVRLWILVNYGGIYMDTDVEVVKPLDEFLNLHAFSGFESHNSISTGVMASEKDFPLFNDMLDDYKNRHFVLKDGTYDQTTNVTIITDFMVKKGIVLNNTIQTIDGLTLYPFDFFCAKSLYDGVIRKTNNTVTIHHFSGSWYSKSRKKVMKIEQWSRQKFGEKYGEVVAYILGIPYRLKVKIENKGIKGTIKYILKKM